MKAIWKDAISFDLTNTSVKLFSATEQSNLDLDMFDSRDMAKIRFQCVNENIGKEVKLVNIEKCQKVHQ